LTKNISLKSLYLVIICNPTHLEEGKTEANFMSRILKKIRVGSETGLGSEPETNLQVGSGSKTKSIPDPQHCPNHYSPDNPEGHHTQHLTKEHPTSLTQKTLYKYYRGLKARKVHYEFPSEFFLTPNIAF
jgi:hypothetical protein